MSLTCSLIYKSCANVAAKQYYEIDKKIAENNIFIQQSSRIDYSCGNIAAIAKAS